MAAQSGTDFPVYPEEYTDPGSPELKARQLLCDILPQNALKEFLEKGFFHHAGKVGVYKISRSRTEIYRHGRLSAFACMQLTIPAPSYDRMIAEYLILNNDETLYWNKANVFPAKFRVVVDLSAIAILVFDVGLLAESRPELPDINFFSPKYPNYANGVKQFVTGRRSRNLRSSRPDIP